MAFISNLASKGKVYSLYTYKPYDDKNFYNKINSLFFEENNPSIMYTKIINEIVNLYKDELVFNLDKKRNYDYICPVISNSKFYNLNKRIAENISEMLNVPVLNDFFLQSYLDKVDYKDMYTKDLSIELEIKDEYLNNDILFVDIMCSTGVVFNYIASKFKEDCNVDFVTIGIRFNADQVNNSKVLNVEELDFDLECLCSDGYVVKIYGLFNKKDVIVDFRKNLSIIIGVNGDGKSTSYKIATLAISNYIGDILQLAKFYFNSIKILKYKNNEIVKTKTINYEDIIISRNKIIEWFAPYESDEIFDYFDEKIEILYDSKYSNVFLDKNNRKEFVDFLSILTDDEYFKVFRKVIYDDKSYQNDIIRLIRKKSLNIHVNIIIKSFETLIKHNLLIGDNTLINAEKQIYFDCTINRKLHHKLYRREMIIDDGFYNFEDYYNEAYFNDEIERYYDLESILEDLDEENFESHKEDFFESDDYYRNQDFYTDDYEYDGYNDMDIEPDDRDIQDWEYERNCKMEEFYDDDIIEEYLNECDKPKYSLKECLEILYPSKLLKKYSFEKTITSFENDININTLFSSMTKNFNYMLEQLDFIDILKYDKKYKDTIDEKLENQFNDYVANNQYLIQFGLYSILSEEQLNDLSSAMNNKKLKNREKFIDSFKRIVEASKDSISKKLVIVEKILNKYYVNKQVNILNNTIFILDQQKNYIPLTALSVGEKNLMILLLFMVFNKKNIVFDEPELSMNITWQYELLKDLLRLRHKNQHITILTQTPQLIKYPTFSSFINSIDGTESNEFAYVKEIGGFDDEMIYVDLYDLGEYITEHDIALVKLIWGESDE